VLTSHVGHHSARIAIECRDRNRPVGVPQIEAFYQKCLDTGIGHGVMVSPSGFYKSAMSKAKSVGIRCLELEQLEAVDWLALKSLVVFQSQLEHLEVTISVKEHGISDLSPQLYDVNGQPVSPETFRDFINGCILKNDPALELGRTAVPFKFAIDGLYGRIPGSGEVLRVIGVCGTSYYVTTVAHEPYEFMRYGETESGTRLTEAAVAELKLGELRAKVAFALDPKKTLKFAVLEGASADFAEPDTAADGWRRR